MHTRLWYCILAALTALLVLVTAERLTMEEQPDRTRLEQIADELRKMARQDQHAIMVEQDTKDAVIRRNTQRMKEIIAEIGWPTRSKVGDASWRAWLLVQHSDHDLDFQRECLRMMIEQPAGEVRLKDIAYLDDRTRVYEGRLQLYGTQFYVDETGTYGPRPIEDPEGLEERRKQMGMESFSEYRQSLLELSRKK
jgi:hypothetical protein